MLFLITLMLEQRTHKLGKAKLSNLIESSLVMNLLKYISSFIWMLCSLGIIYAILRMITSVSKTDFSGNGTKIYLILIVLYTLGTIGLGMLVSKKWFYFLIIFISLCVLSPIILILILNYTNLLK